jgi:hypothetical protein
MHNMRIFIGYFAYWLRNLHPRLSRFDDHRPWRYPVVMSALAIENMTWDEKIRAMEELWESLSREEARLKSPPWHEEALRETAARHDAGKEQPIDWDAAKRELRKRAE